MQTDSQKLNLGLRMFFEGVAMVFDSLGDDSGTEEIVKNFKAIGTGEESEACKARTVQPQPHSISTSNSASSGCVADTATRISQEASKNNKASSKLSVGANEANDTDEKLLNSDEMPETSKDSKTSITLDDITRVIVEKVKQDKDTNNQKIGKLLQKYGTSKVSSLPVSKYEAFMAEVASL